MSRRDQSGMSQQLVAACAMYWLVRDVPWRTVNEMRLELTSHLQAAAQDGKAWQTVVGPDVAQFAESWAATYRPQPSRIRQLAIAIFVVLLIALATVVLEHALYQRALTIVISWGSLIQFGLLLSALALVVWLSKELLSDMPSYRRRGLLIVGGYLLLQIMAGALVRETGLDQRAIISGWSGLATLILGLLAGAVAWCVSRIDAAAATTRSSSGLL